MSFKPYILLFFFNVICKAIVLWGDSLQPAWSWWNVFSKRSVCVDLLRFTFVVDFTVNIFCWHQLHPHTRLYLNFIIQALFFLFSFLHSDADKVAEMESVHKLHGRFIDKKGKYISCVKLPLLVCCPASCIRYINVQGFNSDPSSDRLEDGHWADKCTWL